MSESTPAEIIDAKLERYEHFFRDPRVGDGILQPPRAGIACRNVRDALRYLGYAAVGATGQAADVYDDELRAAVAQFQADCGHGSGDGLVGPGTRKLLTRAMIERGEGWFKRGRVSPEYAVFLSYSRQDESAAIELASGIQAHGIPVFRDKVAIPAGSHWPDVLHRSILKCQVFLCLLSPSSGESINVLIEVALARHANRKILPVIIAPAPLSPSLEALLGHVQWVDLSTAGSVDERLALVLEVLRDHGLKGMG